MDDLISQHFDGALPPAAHQRLTTALTSDPAACRDFAATARLHAGLEALAPPLPPARKRRPAFWFLTSAAAAALLATGSFFLFHHHPASKTTITLEDQNARPDDAPGKPKPSSLTKRIVKAPASALTIGAEPLNVQKLLSRYYVKLNPAGLTVPEVMTGLEQAIKDANVMNRPELDQLSFQVGTPVNPVTPPGFRFPLDNAARPLPFSAREIINLCAKTYRITQAPDGHQYPEERKAVTRDEEWVAKWGVGLFMTSISVDNSGIGPCQFTTSALIFTGPRALLPEGFDEESGLLLDDRDAKEFESILQKSKEASLMRTPLVQQSFDQRCTVDSSGDEAWVPGVVTDYQWTVECTLTGELVKVSGTVGVGKNSRPSQNGTPALDYTEFELYTYRGQTAIFTLDTANQPGFVTVMAVKTNLDRKEGPLLIAPEENSTK